jgi:antitoxin CptB
MDDNTQKTETMRKRLLWRAMHRGIKEMDLIAGGFAQARLAGMSDADLVEFEYLLELPDQDLLAWVTRQEDVPQNLRSDLLLQLISFRPELS